MKNPLLINTEISIHLPGLQYTDEWKRMFRNYIRGNSVRRQKGLAHMLHTLPVHNSYEEVFHTVNSKAVGHSIFYRSVDKQKFHPRNKHTPLHQLP